MLAQLPHAATPFTLTRTGTVTVEQGSEQHIKDSVYNIAVCPQGFRDDLPDFGIPDLTFNTMPWDLASLEEALKRWEPSADLSLEQHREAVAQAGVTINVS